MTGEEE